MNNGSTYLPPSLEHLGEDVLEEDLINEVPGEFKTGLDTIMPTEEPFPKWVCKHCGKDEFQIGYRYYCTRVRCTNCIWETVIHSG